MTPSGGEERKRTRRSEEEDSNTLYIPEEIVWNFLSRLPGKSLSRFKCVCKRWCSLIAIRQNNKLLLLSDKSLLHSVDQHGTLKPIAEPWQRYLSPSRYRNTKILGSCDGLVLIRINQDLFLWNPVTRYFKKVWSKDAWNVNIARIVVSGLCYDSSTDEYKAVLATNTLSPKTVVGSLRSKSWTEVQYPYAKFWLNPGPIVNGHLYWSYASGKQGYYDFILKFNPHMNEFAKVLMPQCEHGRKIIILGLGALDGCLCMARLDKQSNSQGNVEVLVMKGSCGVEQAWHAMFTISNSTIGFKIADMLVPLYSTTNGEVLVKTRIWKDMERITTIKAYKANHEVSDRDIHTAHCINAVQYEESLVEPIGYEL